MLFQRGFSDIIALYALILVLFVGGMIYTGKIHVDGLTKPTPTLSPTSTPQAKNATTEEDCKKTDGVWRADGLNPNKRCFYQAKDAGKSCTDGDQCEYECISFDASIAGRKVEGKCEEWSTTFGCFSKIEDGKSESALCVD